MRRLSIPISYAMTIAPIVQEKCVSCHQPGGIGPMPLTNYEEIKPFAPMIREVIRVQRMPPWRADPSVGHFLGDRSLSSVQIKELVHWVEQGAPRAEGVDPRSKQTFLAEEWPLGKPDLVLDIPAYNIPANGIVDYQRPFVVNPLNEGKWLRLDHQGHSDTVLVPEGGANRQTPLWSPLNVDLIFVCYARAVLQRVRHTHLPEVHTRQSLTITRFLCCSIAVARPVRFVGGFNARCLYRDRQGKRARFARA